MSNISNLTFRLNSLYNNKHNNITLNAGNNITITESPTDTWTINSAGSTLTGTNNI